MGIPKEIPWNKYSLRLETNSSDSSSIYQPLTTCQHIWHGTHGSMAKPEATDDSQSHTCRRHRTFVQCSRISHRPGLGWFPCIYYCYVCTMTTGRFRLLISLWVWHHPTFQLDLVKPMKKIIQFNFDNF